MPKEENDNRYGRLGPGTKKELLEHRSARV